MNLKFWLKRSFSADLYLATMSCGSEHRNEILSH
jgi:hypothetical protein